MSTLLLDASVAGSWLLDDELDPRAGRAAERVPEDGALMLRLLTDERDDLVGSARG